MMHRPYVSSAAQAREKKPPTERAPQNRMQMNRLKDSTDEYAHNLMHLEVINASQATLRCILVHI